MWNVCCARVIATVHPKYLCLENDGASMVFILFVILALCAIFFVVVVVVISFLLLIFFWSLFILRLFLTYFYFCSRVSLLLTAIMYDNINLYIFKEKCSDFLSSRFFFLSLSKMNICLDLTTKFFFPKKKLWLCCKLKILIINLQHSQFCFFFSKKKYSEI